jgi:hypothetical protein
VTLFDRILEFLCGLFTDHKDSVTMWARGWPMEHQERICKRCGKVLERWRTNSDLEVRW